MKVKICGITRKEDALLAAELGAWALGFIFVRSSPRYIEPALARAIIGALKEPIVTVGVFSNSTLEEMRVSVSRSGVQLAQLHGNETAGTASAIGVPFIKALSLSRSGDLARAASEYHDAHALLIDAAPKDGMRGGTGQIADWSLAQEKVAGKLVILAGGIRSDNVRQAIQEVRPDAIDLSSGLESAPGVKSPTKMREFFEVSQDVE